MNKLQEKGKNFALAFLNLGLFYILPILFSSLIASFVAGSNNLIKDIALFSIEFFLAIIMFLINIKLLKEDFENFKKNYKSCLNEGFKYYVIGLIMMVATNILIVNLNGGNIANNEELNRSIISVYPIYAISSIALLGPLTEEITFRGGFKKAFSSIVFYTVFTGILFGGAHVLGSINTFSDVLFIIPYSVLGMVFSYICYKTDNIFTSISIHIFHNCLSLIIIFLGGGL